MNNLNLKGFDKVEADWDTEIKLTPSQLELTYDTYWQKIVSFSHLQSQVFTSSCSLQ